MASLRIFYLDTGCGIAWGRLLLPVPTNSASQSCHRKEVGAAVRMEVNYAFLTLHKRHFFKIRNSYRINSFSKYLQFSNMIIILEFIDVIKPSQLE
jgi:hypothetical protein